MSYMRAQKLANFLIWREIPKIIKKSKKQNKNQHATGDQNVKSKTRIFLQILLFFYTVSKP